MLKFGPSRQVWVSPEMLDKVYEKPECAGRPASFKDPFGEFLFLVRDPKDAEPIREKQKAWLEKNLDAAKIGEAAKSALAEHVWPVLEAAEQEFPADQMRVATYSAVTTAMLGESQLSAKELDRLMSATREYSEMRVKKKFGKGADGTPPGAADIREIVEAAIGRTGRTDVVLPLMVAASIGGAEIFPTLLHWIFLHFAREPSRQEAAAAAAKRGDNAELLSEVYRALRSNAYSVALGPPRKVLADAVVDDLLIPEGALLFALHPAVVDMALDRSPVEEDFSKYAFGIGPRSCLGRPLAEAILPAVVGCVLERYKVSPGGQLIRPNAVKMRWEKRDEEGAEQLQLQLQKLQEEYGNFRQQTEKIQRNMEAELEDNQETITHTKESLARVLEEKNRIEKERDALHARMEYQQKDLETAKAEAMRAKEEASKPAEPSSPSSAVKEYEAKLAALHAQCREASAAQRGLQEGLSEAERALAAAEVEKEELRERMRELEGRLEEEVAAAKKAKNELAQKVQLEAQREESPGEETRLRKDWSWSASERH
ncbi:unnamed protein product [Effrenium voratum]|uniref:Cytochrome P450 n=1 Tax=Effrenium voratum TaxID=2562239 RepID=A0AA36INQ7_9DINO|nr:unnamed protein product [Effrenium voratum]